jgi:hypothetical protein
VYEGYTYNIVKLDVAQYGGPVPWLLQLVRANMGLDTNDWNAYQGELKAILKNLWLDPESLIEAAEPLMSRLGIVTLEPDLFAQAEKIRAVICSAAAALRPPDDALTGSHYELLNKLYGLGGKEKELFTRSLNRPTQEAVASMLGIGYSRPFGKHLKSAIGALYQEILRKMS